MADTGRRRQWASLVVVIACCSCGNSSSSGASARDTLRSAAGATAQAHSFTLSILGADVTYQAPDRVQQVEHGQGTSASATNGGSASSTGPFAVTITKIFIGDRSYEANTAAAASPEFSVATRCPNEQNAAEFVLSLLQRIAASAEVDGPGPAFSFRIPQQPGTVLPTSGTATVTDGFVRSLSFTPATSSVSAVKIDSINSAPPVTAPMSASPTNDTCG